MLFGEEESPKNECERDQDLVEVFQKLKGEVFALYERGKVNKNKVEEIGGEVRLHEIAQTLLEIEANGPRELGAKTKHLLLLLADASVAAQEQGQQVKDKMVQSQRWFHKQGKCRHGPKCKFAHGFK